MRVEDVGWFLLLGALVAFVVGNFLPGWVGPNDAAYILSLVLTFIVAPALVGVGAVVLWRRRRGG